MEKQPLKPIACGRLQGSATQKRWVPEKGCKKRSAQLSSCTLLFNCGHCPRPGLNPRNGQCLFMRRGRHRVVGLLHWRFKIRPGFGSLTSRQALNRVAFFNPQCNRPTTERDPVQLSCCRFLCNIKDVMLLNIAKRKSIPSLREIILIGHYS